MALNSASGYDELVVEENDSQSRTYSRHRHPCVPPHASAGPSLPPAPMTMEESLLTDRHSEQLTDEMYSDVEPEAEPVDRLRAGDRHQLAVELVPGEGVQSLHASEVWM